MEIGDTRIKYVKRAGMWVKTTLLNRSWVKSKKKGTELYLKDKYQQEWFSK